MFTQPAPRGPTGEGEGGPAGMASTVRVRCSVPWVWGQSCLGRAHPTKWNPVVMAALPVAEPSRPGAIHTDCASRVMPVAPRS